MKIKKPTSISAKQRNEDKQINCMAAMTKDQAMLDKLLEGSPPAMRAAMLERLTPHLPFVPREDAIAGCPNCGMRRGSVIDHACSVN